MKKFIRKLKLFIKGIKFFVPSIVFLLIFFTIWVCLGHSYSEIVSELIGGLFV